MASQKREKVEETDPICTLPQPIQTPPPPHIPVIRSPDTPDPNILDPRTSSANPPEKLVKEKSLKRGRDESVSRCSGSGCRKRIGLMGFRCRCGDTFCSEHRYSDRHECSYDYKAAGRELIARENPIVRASKLLKV